MTDEHTTDEHTTDEPTQGDHATVEDDEDTGTVEDDDGGDREAAKYRRRLRAVEAERDALQGVVDGYRRAEVEQVAGTVLVAADELWREPDVTVADFLTDDGAVNVDAVQERARALVANRPHLGRPFPDLGQGRRGETPPSTSWSEVIKGR